MDLSQLQDEVRSRGFDYVSDTRINYWLNLAYTRLAEKEAWSWLETEATGSSPLTIADFRAALSVVDTTNGNPLGFEDIRNLYDDDPPLTTTGNPSCWYLSSPTVIATWPTTSVSLRVRYLKVPDPLTDSANEPLFPERYHYALVDGALVWAYQDSDNGEMADRCQDAFDAAVLLMGDALNVPNLDSARTLVITDASTDW